MHKKSKFLRKELNAETLQIQIKIQIQIQNSENFHILLDNFGVMKVK
jgi:hypothetical protein